MEPTIYKPSIYKGAGIYKIGTDGGGGGGGVIIPENYRQLNFFKRTSSSNEDCFVLNCNIDYDDKLFFDVDKPRNPVGTSDCGLFATSFYNGYVGFRGNTNPPYIILFNAKPNWDNGLATFYKGYDIIEGRGIICYSCPDFANIDNETFYMHNNYGSNPTSGSSTYLQIPVARYGIFEQKIYSVKLTNNNNMIKNWFVPVEEREQNKKGLYDIATGTFYECPNDAYFEFG